MPLFQINRQIPATCTTLLSIRNLLMVVSEKNISSLILSSRFHDGEYIAKETNSEIP